MSICVSCKCVKGSGDKTDMPSSPAGTLSSRKLKRSRQQSQAEAMILWCEIADDPNYTFRSLKASKSVDGLQSVFSRRVR